MNCCEGCNVRSEVTVRVAAVERNVETKFKCGSLVYIKIKGLQSLCIRISNAFSYSNGLNKITFIRVKLFT